MRIAVSGAGGFIGRHVLAELAKRENTPIALVRGDDAGDFPGSPECYKVDIAKSGTVTPAEIGDPDALIHLAWGGLPNYRSNHHFEIELPAQHQFLSGLIKGGLKNLVCAGTCFEYGMQYGPLSEDMPTRPENSYGFAKDTLRQQLEYLRMQTPYNLAWARLFFLYGAGQAANSLFPQLHRAVTEGRDVFDMSGGEQLRDYLPVETVAQNIVDLAISNPDCGPINICSGEPISIRRLVETWCLENGWSIDLNLGYYPYPDYEPMAFWGSSNKMEQVGLKARNCAKHI
ncbi:MAG: NAD(P)-dependent oxidoreductase [Tateyamaria sp.]|uniref:NAD-dependent epimerase/dehydratase family protein n=1 Tax=Tateyamaria sp. TaxID=1929288 RepID=UPI00329CA397